MKMDTGRLTALCWLSSPRSMGKGCVKMLCKQTRENQREALFGIDDKTPPWRTFRTQFADHLNCWHVFLLNLNALLRGL